MRTLLGTLTLLATAASHPAQDPPFVGRWEIQIQAGIHEADGKVTPVMSPGTISFAVEGDSLIAILSMAMAGPRPPARLATRLVGDTATFVKQINALRTIDNRMTPSVATRRYRFVVRNDSLIGTMDTIDGDDAKVPKLNNWPVLGSRAISR